MRSVSNASAPWPSTFFDTSDLPVKGNGRPVVAADYAFKDLPQALRWVYGARLRDLAPAPPPQVTVQIAGSSELPAGEHVVRIQDVALDSKGNIKVSANLLRGAGLVLQRFANAVEDAAEDDSYVALAAAKKEGAR
jgi:hypothetical protein